MMYSRYYKDGKRKTDKPAEDINELIQQIASVIKEQDTVLISPDSRLAQELKKPVKSAKPKAKAKKEDNK